MLKESAVAHFKLRYQHLSEGISNVKLGIVTKIKLSLGLINHAIRSGGCGDIALPFLTSALDRDVAYFMTQPFYTQENSTWYPPHKRLGGSQSQSGCYEEKKSLLLLPRIKPQLLNCTAFSIVSILTKISNSSLTQTA
jgi:hypothetical protein